MKGKGKSSSIGGMMGEGGKRGRRNEGEGKKQQRRRVGGKQGRKDERGGRGQRSRGNSMIEAMKGVNSQIQYTHCQPNQVYINT